MEEVEHILQFLQYGTPAERIASLSSSTAAPFLPSLALSASDSPALIPHLLPPLCSQRQVPRALAYAGLDFVEIAQAVLEAEAEVAAGKAISDGVAAEVSEQEEEGGEVSKESHWKWENEVEIDVVDECHAFEVADEKERVRLAIVSVRKRAREFSAKVPGSGVVEKEVSHHQERDEGSMWSNEAYLPELLCLLPVAVSRCPTLLPPELLVKGLLSTSSGCSLLVTTFANNPAVVERGALALASILSRHGEFHENHSGSPHASDSTSAVRAGGGSGTLSRQHSGAQSYDFAPLLTSPYAQVTTSVLVSLCRIAPSFAAICREALVNICTLAEMALHITVEIFHDELQFLSKLIFPKERTSRWILSFLGANQKHGDSQHALMSLRSLSAKESDSPADTKATSITQPSTKGVTTRVRDALLADARMTWKKQGWCGKLHAHLRLYCVLIRAGDLQPTHEEVDFWIRLLGGTMEHSGGESRHTEKPAFVSERTLQLGICFVCLVPGLSSPSTKTLLHACIANLLRAANGSAPYSVCTPEIELAVWVAVQLLMRRFADIAGLVRDALGMHVTVHTASMRDLADAAGGVLSDPFTAASVAAALRPSGPVPSYKKRQCLGLKCLEQLLNTSTFARCSVDISETVMHYICIAGEPIHPVLPVIVQGFTELSVTAPRLRGGLPRYRMRPFSRASLVKAMAPGFAILKNGLSKSKISQMERFPGSMKLSSNNAQNLHQKGAVQKYANGDPLATAALVTYYILCREQIVRSMGIPGSSNNDSMNSPSDGGDDGWWMDLLNSLPLRELLMYMETNWPAYEHLLPQWLCVASLVFPERFTAQSLLQDLEKTNTSFDTHVKGIPITEDLDWVGPPHATLLRKSEVEMAVVPPLQDPPAVLEQRVQPEVAVGAVPLMISLQTEKSWTSPMDIDKEYPEVVQSKPDEEGRQKAETQSSAMDINEGKSMGNTNLLSLEALTAAMKKAVENPLPALRILNAIMTNSHLGAGCDLENVETMAGFGAEWHLETAMMKALVPNLLDSSCPRCLQDQFCSWWRTLPYSSLEHLVPVLWDLIKDPCIPTKEYPVTDPEEISLRLLASPQSTKLVKYSTGLAEEPLKLLACNVKVFRNPLLGIVLDLLLELLVANRRLCQVAASEGGRDSGIKRDEVAAAMVAQDSAVCQILLEACLPKKEFDDERKPGPLLEARSCICATICSMLYRSPLLLKLLHFQGYDIRLIPMMVEGVPVMVQCLEFIGELLQQSQQQRQVFVAALIAHLTSLHSDLPQSLTAAQQVVGQVTQMRTKVAGCAGYLQEVLGAVAQCASTFPILAPQVVALLQSCAQAGGPLTRSGPPRDAALHAAAVAAFKYLVQGKLLHGRPPPAI